MKAKLQVIENSVNITEIIQNRANSAIITLSLYTMSSIIVILFTIKLWKLFSTGDHLIDGIKIIWFLFVLYGLYNYYIFITFLLYFFF